MFWFLGHPEVYIVLLPALGITSEVIATNSRKPIFGYRAMIGSMLGITVLSFVVWAHHMFVSGLNPFLGSVFMFLTLIIAIPSAVKVFNYLTTLWKGNIIFTPATLFSIGLVSFFISGGLTGIFLGNSVIDIQLHDTYFVVAHFHLVMGSLSVFGLLAGVYHWFPKMFGRMMDEKLGHIHFWMTFIGVYMIFFPMHYIGIAGFPRRYYSWTNFDAFSSYTDLNMFVSIAAFVTVAAQFLFLFNFFYSMYRGKRAPQNPWRSNTLEWTAPIEPGHGNWPGEIPKVYRWPYDYSKPGAKEDFIPQHIPLSQTPESNLDHEVELAKKKLLIKQLMQNQTPNTSFKISSYYRNLTLLTVIAVYLLILAGGIVRSTGSGMGCPDWPKCFGQWIPPTSADELPEDYQDFYAEYRHQKNIKFAKYLDVFGYSEIGKTILEDESIKEEAAFNASKTWTEYLNRLLGAVVGFLIILCVAGSFPYIKKSKSIFVLALSSLILVLIQGWIGSVVVSTNLLSWLITVHMVLALVILAVLTALYFVVHQKLDKKQTEITEHKKLKYVLVVAMLMILVQIVLGTQVRESLDIVANRLGDALRGSWIEGLGVEFYIHRSFLSQLQLFTFIFCSNYLRQKMS